MHRVECTKLSHFVRKRAAPPPESIVCRGALKQATWRPF